MFSFLINVAIARQVFFRDAGQRKVINVYLQISYFTFFIFCRRINWKFINPTAKDVKKNKTNMNNEICKWTLITFFCPASHSVSYDSERNISLNLVDLIDS